MVILDFDDIRLLSYSLEHWSGNSNKILIDDAPYSRTSRDPIIWLSNSLANLVPNMLTLLAKVCV